MVAVLCLPPGLALAQTSTAYTLPIGTRIDFIADDAVNTATVRPGGSFRIHLAQPLTLDGMPLATAGTPARLLVADTFKRPDGTVMLSIALGGFRLKAGELPLTPIDVNLSAVTPGMTIAASTLGSIERAQDRIVIRVPVPAQLSSAAPISAFTALPALTPAPLLPVPRRGASPTPLPTTFNPPEPSDAPSDAPSASPT
jgi:hypothetical protein